MVQLQTNCAEGQAHSRATECNCEQVVQRQAGYSGVVSESGDVRLLMCKMTHTSGGSVYQQNQPQASKFVSPVPYPKAWKADALSLCWEELDGYVLPPGTKWSPRFSIRVVNSWTLLPQDGPTCLGFETCSVC